MMTVLQNFAPALCTYARPPQQGSCRDMTRNVGRWQNQPIVTYPDPPPEQEKLCMDPVRRMTWRRKKEDAQFLDPSMKNQRESVWGWVAAEEAEDNVLVYGLSFS